MNKEDYANLKIETTRKLLDNPLLKDKLSKKYLEAQTLLKEYEDLMKLFQNPNREKIYLLAKKEKLNITQISKKIGLSYQNTFSHIKILIAYGLLKSEKQYTGVQGQTVLISTTNKQYGDLLKEKGGQLDKPIKEIFNNLF